MIRSFIIVALFLCVTTSVFAQTPAIIPQVGISNPEELDNATLLGIATDLWEVRPDFTIGTAIDFWRHTIYFNDEPTSPYFYRTTYAALGIYAKYMVNSDQQFYQLYAGLGPALHVIRSNTDNGDPTVQIALPGGEKIGLDIFSGVEIDLSKRISWIVQGGYRLVSELSQSVLTTGVKIQL